MWEIYLYLDISTSEDGCKDISPLFLFKGCLLASRIKSLNTVRTFKLMLNANKWASINEIDHTVKRQDLMMESAP